jgi:hypothetical protein
MQSRKQDTIIGAPDHRKEAGMSSPGPAELSEDDLV